MMNEYVLSPKALRITAGSSNGGQPKYYDEPYWYKIDYEGYEGKAEYLASLVLESSNLSEDEYVRYEECKVNGKDGCRSLNFLSSDESFISLERLYMMYTEKSLADNIRNIPEPIDRINFVIDFVYNKTELDITQYISKTLSLDCLILNSDRHFNNLGIIVNSKDNIFRTAPIFDNGACLCSNVARYPYPSLDENKAEIIGMPFYGNLEMQSMLLSSGLEIDYNKLYSKLDNVEDCRAKRFLTEQLKTYEKTYNTLIEEYER